MNIIDTENKYIIEVRILESRQSRIRVVINKITNNPILYGVEQSKILIRDYGQELNDNQADMDEIRFKNAEYFI